jgi:hypothetical protein
LGGGIIGQSPVFNKSRYHAGVAATPRFGFLINGGLQKFKFLIKPPSHSTKLPKNGNQVAGYKPDKAWTKNCTAAYD